MSPFFLLFILMILIWVSLLLSSLLLLFSYLFQKEEETEIAKLSGALNQDTAISPDTVSTYIYLITVTDN